MQCKCKRLECQSVGIFPISSDNIIRIIFHTLITKSVFKQCMLRIGQILKTEFFADKQNKNLQGLADKCMQY